MQSFPSIQHTKWRLTVFLCLLAYLSATAQTIENIRTSFDQSSQLMFIYYDVKGLNYKKEIMITPKIIRGDTSPVPIKSISGDTGWLNQGGRNKLIIWDNFEDGVDSLNSVKIEIIPEVRKAVIPHYWGLALQGSNSAPFGIKIIRLNHFGVFAGFRTGKLPPAYRYTISNSGEMNYLESGVYEIGSKRRLASYAITAGPVFQMTRTIYVYTGAGYGAEQIFWEYQSFNLDKTLLGNNWALNETINRKGIVTDIGAVFRLGHVLIDLGLSTIQFKSFQITGGLGLSFSEK